MKDAQFDHIVSPRLPVGRGEPLLADEPQTLPEIFIKAAKRFDLSDALNYHADKGWEHISSQEMVETIATTAHGLKSLGLMPQDRAAILAPNSHNWTFADAACQFAGVIDVPIYTTLAPSSVAYILNDSGARLLFVADIEMYRGIAGVLKECPTVEMIVFFDGSGIEDVANAITFDTLLQKGAERRLSHPNEIDETVGSLKPESIATLIYTSGTTGEPKGVMLTHANIISNVIDTGEHYDFSQHDKCLSVLPLSHIFERSAMYLYIFNGMSVYYAESIERVAENLAEVQPTILVGVPRIFEKVYAKAKLKAARSGVVKERIFDSAIETAKQYSQSMETTDSVGFGLKVKHKIADRLIFSKLREFFGGNLRLCITGGAALPNDIYLIFNGAGIPIMQGYGLTETSPVISSNNPKHKRLGSSGKPIRNMYVRIASDGEIEASGAGVMLGYYNKPDATRDAFTDDGWFRTGDIGDIDSDGFLKITDRKKELFKTSGGKYIAPSPIEQMIRSSRFVSQVVLVGNERKFPAALIVPNFEMLESYAKHKGLAINSHAEFCSNNKIIDLIGRQVAGLTDSLAKYEKVKKIALLENELSVVGGELTPTLKVKRRVVDEKYKTVIDKIYADAENEKRLSEK
jgi:long-chain acyl-CoA synthetase